MSIALQQYYKFDRQVSVVYNSFPPGNIQDNHIQKIPNSLVWFSQTVGPNRGIEDFINVLRQLDIPVEIHFIGFSSISYREYLVECLNGTPHR
jgi:glycosyltransferase involved in cell wall biosynthesis